MNTRLSLTNDFRALGVEAGATIMLHASVRAVGPVAGGPDQIHLALKDALTPEGTLMMLAGCPDLYDDIGRGIYDPATEQEILDSLPAFDPDTARCDRTNGILVEFLRTWPGSVVSRHVTRFVAWGREAAWLVNPQPWHHAFGRGSALERLQDRNGQVLLLGSDHDAVTLLHYAEAIVDIPGKRVVRVQVPVEEGGKRVWREMEEFDSSNGAHPNWPDRFFARIVGGYLRSSGRQPSRVGGATAFLFPARELVDYALPVMRAVGEDPGAVNGLGEWGGRGNRRESAEIAVLDSSRVNRKGAESAKTR